MNTLELKVLATIIDEIGIITLNKNVNTYKLCLYIKFKKVTNYELDIFIKELVNNNNSFLFNCDFTNGRYYIYGSKVITLFELLKDQLLHKIYDKVDLVLDHKHLFTRSKGKKLTKEELEQLANLYNELRK